MKASDYAQMSHDACVRARNAAWAMRKACKRDNPEAWRDLCEAIAEATDAAGKWMDETSCRESEPIDAEEAKELVREVTWENFF